MTDVMEKWEILYLDVWGNAEDGWEVNQTFRSMQIEMPEDFTEEGIIPLLKWLDVLEPAYPNEIFEVCWDSESFIEVNRSTDARPLVHIQKVYEQASAM